jgi:drug/metabolite transporter (DMT)-like permease
MGMVHQDVLGHTDSWFAASSAVLIRFGLAALITLVWSWRTLGQITGLEAWQGFGLGVCAGLGMLFQVDGLTYTSASISAFLTQCGCLILPWLVAWRDRQWPSRLIVMCSVLAAFGVAILAGVDWRQFRLGRGEFETLISSFIFTGQILWLERPIFAQNRVRHFTLVMFVTMALIVAPVALATSRGAGDWVMAYSSPVVLGLVGVLVLFCTMIAFVLMNRWQRFLPAPEAGLIYATEPVFASLFALFLPAWLSVLAGVLYPNESLTGRLLVGGGLITLANLLIQLQATRRLRAQPGTDAVGPAPGAGLPARVQPASPDCQ